jgi:HPt (histidine-containing phosphotransfer) domain-containing protein/CheY-like chemotaxis protein
MDNLRNPQRQIFTVFFCGNLDVSIKSLLTNRFPQNFYSFHFVDNLKPEQLSTLPTQLILLDLDIVNPAIIFQIRLPHSVNQTNPVIALLPNDKQCHKKVLIKDGFDDCLLKPVNFQILEEIIETWESSYSVNNLSCDIEVLVKTCHYNTDIARVLLLKLFDELSIQLTQIENNLYQNSAVTFDAVHKLVGNLKTCRLNTLSTFALALENSLNTQNDEVIVVNWQRLKAECQCFINMRDDILGKLDNFSIFLETK